MSVEQQKQPARVRAPELTGDSWLNTGGDDIRLADLRGKIVLLDFWTLGCINCMHVLDELRPIEKDFADELVTIGVHSPKFLHEGETAAIEAAVLRYGIEHPVLNDPELVTWRHYAIKAWPTLVVIDPEGYIVHVAAGEGHGSALRKVLSGTVRTHAEKGTLRRGGSHYAPIDRDNGALSFPAKALSTADGTVLVADTANDSIAEISGDGETVLRRFGTGERGATDGAADVATFSAPSGIAVLPADVAVDVGYNVVVADTGSHLLRGIDTATGTVSTVAGTGRQFRDGDTRGEALGIDLTSPWDVAWYEPAGGVVTAMAGNHTLGLFDPRDGRISRFAGTTIEGLRDGPVEQAFFAQTSGLATAGETLWLVDAETSALRWIEPSGSGFTVHTAVGTDLFSFGHVDGPAGAALLQHPLGIAVEREGTIAIADTYNGAVRRFDPKTEVISTVAEGLSEPSGLFVFDNELWVVESAVHRVRALPRTEHKNVSGAAHAVRRPPTELAHGEVELSVVFTPPPGEKLDERYGPSTRLEISAAPPELIAEGAGTDTPLTRVIRLAEGHTEGVLQVVAQATSCDDDVEHPVCRVARQDWGVPVRVVDGGSESLELVMAGSTDRPIADT